jgi:hypothetical protein
MSSLTRRQCRLRKRYTRLTKDGEWQAYLVVEGQAFCICSCAAKAEANYFARMLAKAIDRLLQTETKTNKEIKTKMPNPIQGETHAPPR